MRTIPPGAKLSVNGNYVGVTPVDFTVSRHEINTGPLDYRLEADGYAPADGQFPVVVSAGRIVGTVFTAGILAAFKGFHVFEHDDMTVALQPSTWTSAPASAGEPRPKSPKIFITTAPLKSLPAGSYLWVKDIEISRHFYGNYTGLFDEMAVEARGAGADAVFAVEKHMHTSMVAWAVPRVTGKAIVIKDPCALKGISGDVYPREEADTPDNLPVTARCETGQGTQPRTAAGQPARGALVQCTVEQVLSMKNAGFSDQQIRAACPK